MLKFVIGCCRPCETPFPQLILSRIVMSKVVFYKMSFAGCARQQQYLAAVGQNWRIIVEIVIAQQQVLINHVTSESWSQVTLVTRPWGMNATAQSISGPAFFRLRSP